jgi:hypothetical protein
VTLRARWVTLRARWVTLRARWVTLRARWVTLRARWVTLRARWVTLRSRWVTLRARWLTQDAPLLLMSATALNMILGREVYSNNSQIGGPKVRPASPQQNSDQDQPNAQRDSGLSYTAFLAPRRASLSRLLSRPGVSCASGDVSQRRDTHGGGGRSQRRGCNPQMVVVHPVQKRRTPAVHTAHGPHRGKCLPPPGFPTRFCSLGHCDSRCLAHCDVALRYRGPCQPDPK